jgi:capsular polysaccharide biosynthesis protein
VSSRITVVDVTDPGYALRNGYLVDPERRVVYERKVVPAFRDLRVAVEPLERPVRREGVVASLAQADNYGHWLLLALPLVAYYREVLGGDPDFYYVGRRARRVHAETFRLLGIPAKRILAEPVQADRLLSAVTDRALGYDTEFLLFADKHLRPDTVRAGGDRLVLVSRATAAHRRLVNEAECAAALRSAFGVELVRTDDMTLQDEIELFRNARLVIGAHGAGLTNAVFAPFGSALVEIAASTYWDSLFAQIAAAKRHRYRLLAGDPAGPTSGVTPSHHHVRADVDAVVAAVSDALCGDTPTS